MTNWKETTLGALIDIKHGYAFKGEYFSDVPNGNVILTPGNFGINGGFKNAKSKCYTDHIPLSYILNEGDVIVTMTDLSKDGDTLGYSAKIPKDVLNKYLHNQRIGLVQLKSDEADLNFIYWLMRWRDYQLFIVNTATGSTVRHTAPKKIQSFSFFLPSLEEQKEIAGVLGSLDDKIELLREQNKTLEATAQAVFKEWFVNFNFPNIEGKSYKSSGGKMIDSELGQIPDGWRVGQLSELCKKLASGGTPATSNDEYWGGEINWFSTKELHDNYIFESEKKITQNGLSNSSAKIFPKGSVVMAIYAAPTVGRLGILVKDSSFNQAACGFIAKNEAACSEFIYLFLHYSRKDLNNLANGAAQQNISVGLLRNLKLVIPVSGVMDRFKKIANPIFEKVLHNSIQIQTLSTLRDTLLPKLMSGELCTGESVD